jgi:HD-GYP domain-containing protein (c-di-GMP phosphodiesterase class II)
LGKITISKDILLKPGPLTDKEWDRVKRHPETGYKIAMGKEAALAEIERC